MLTERVTVLLPYGIHAAIAHRLHRSASRFSSSVFLRASSETASLRSVVAVLALGVQSGAEIDILADGADEAAAVAAVVAMLQSTTDAPDRTSSTRTRSA